MTLDNSTPIKVCRGIRGATIIEENTPEAILKGTRELLALIIRLNGIQLV